MSAPALLKGLDILECLDRESVPLSLSQLANALGRNKSEIQRMVKSLCERGYIERNDQGGYTLGFQLYKLGRMRYPYRHLQRVAEPIMSAFAIESGHSIHIGVEHQGRMLNLSGSTGSNIVSVAVLMGMELPLDTTLSGRVILAYDSDAKNSEDFHALEKQGYLYRENHEYEGVRDLSVPITLCPGEVYAALTCSWLASVDSKKAKNSGGEIPRISQEVKKCALLIEEKLK